MTCLSRALLAAVSGAVLALGFTDVWTGVIWFALAPPLYWVAEARTKREACGYAAVFAWAWTFPSLWFLAQTTGYGAVAAAVYTGLWYIGGLMAVRCAVRRGVVSAVFGTAAIWCLIEIARSRIPIFQFPWLLLGHATAPCEALRQGADLFGVYGLSFLAVSVNAVLAFVVVPLSAPRLPTAAGTPFARRVVLTTVLGTLFAALLYGRWRIAEIEPLLVEGPPRVAVVQGCEYQKLFRTDEEKWRQLNGHLELHAQAAQRVPRPDLICWAETMVPGVYNQDPYAERFRAVVREHGIPTLCGADWIHPDDLAKTFPEQRWLNTALLLDGQAETLGQYAKRRLVPFGEYVPLKQVFPFVEKMVQAISDFSPGSDIVLLPLPHCRLGTVICYEIIFPNLVRQFVARGAQAIVNITNDAWFGATSAPVQHLAIAVFRAVENRRWIARCANTGISAVITPSGRIQARTDIFTETVLSDVLYCTTKKTVYTTFGDFFAQLCCAASVLIMLVALRQRRNPLFR